jgi:DnaD/phage-associated family protein
VAFPGFSDDVTAQIRIPEQFFRQVLPGIKNLNELRLTLVVFWRLERMEGSIHYLLFSELLKEKFLIASLSKEKDKVPSALQAALNLAVRHGTLLHAPITTSSGEDKIICLNSPRGRAVISAIQSGDWQMPERLDQVVESYTEHPNIFQLYEANIGPLTPLIADALRDAENTYQLDWIEDAFRIAVERNKRNWHYIEAILHRWQEGGRDDRKDQPARRDTEEARRRYGEWEG